MLLTDNQPCGLIVYILNLSQINNVTTNRQIITGKDQIRSRHKYNADKC